MKKQSSCNNEPRFFARAYVLFVLDHVTCAGELLDWIARERIEHDVITYRPIAIGDKAARAALLVDDQSASRVREWLTFRGVRDAS